MGDKITTLILKFTFKGFTLLFMSTVFLYGLENTNTPSLKSQTGISKLDHYVDAKNFLKDFPKYFEDKEILEVITL